MTNSRRAFWSNSALRAWALVIGNSLLIASLVIGHFSNHLDQRQERVHTASLLQLPQPAQGRLSARSSQRGLRQRAKLGFDLAIGERVLRVATGIIHSLGQSAAIAQT